MSCCTTGTAAAVEGIATVYEVSGMTCGHCKATLALEIGAVDGVLAVDVDLEAGQVTVTTADEPDDALLAEVVDDAGYELTGRAS
ncbi:heavy-metal-associated domain-containing protein [Streptomyces sp. H51]|uniref:heavy-metal-associated domain-containing protein n=1 Tax=Streptomyces sp. H51 TaxID=3111770 RepID=UPI002D79E94B|nr:heavy-metal-associated domain-containing protein [Streptomyces sp. H51]